MKRPSVASALVLAWRYIITSAMTDATTHGHSHAHEHAHAETAPAPGGPAPAGIHLLLKGRENAHGTGANLPPWLLPVLLGADAALVLAGAGLLVSSSPRARFAAAAVFILVGAVLGATAILLRGRGTSASVSPIAAPNGAATGKPTNASGEEGDKPRTVRVHFIDELPRKR